MFDNIYVGLVHYPVYNKKRETVCTSITNLDLHDIARSCKTYGIMNLFIINPQESQKQIFIRLKKFWKSDIAKRYNIDRFDAFDIIEFVSDISSAKVWIEKKFNSQPIVISTSARKATGSLKYKEVRDILRRSFPKLILFGTGNGLADKVINQSNFHLQEIKGVRNYNHLSVRSAVSVTLDRLIAEYE
ncbi:MAG: RNA methyltransferase [Candidatus Cloacimonetes bacterium]|nr:RNA methyltransferase [Candidatus Cloacimonadota bacterium]